MCSVIEARRLRRFFFLVSATALALSGCAGTRKAAEKPAGLVYRWEVGKAVRYEITSESHQSMETMGQTFETTSTSLMRVTATPVEVYDDGSALVDFVMDTLSVLVKSAMGETSPDVKALLGKHIRRKVAPTGKFIGEVDSTQQLVIKLGQMGSVNLEDNFRRLLVRVPGRPVQIGDTWTDTDTTHAKQGGLDIAVFSTTKHQVVGKEVVQGTMCYHVKSEGTFSMEGSGQEPMSGSEMAFEGEGTSQSEWYFDPQGGRLLQLNATITMEGTVAVSGQADMTIPLETVSKVKVQLLPES